MAVLEKGTRLVKLNWDKACEIDFLTGKAFEICQHAMKNKRASMKEEEIPDKEYKSKFGTHSPHYGSDWSDNDAFAERYMCRCGSLFGRSFLGMTCNVCGVAVEFKDVDLSVTGWMILKGYKIIHPIYYNKLASVIGQDTFSKIITFNKKVTLNGELEYDVDPKQPFNGIGIEEFEERFDEVIAFYRKKVKSTKAKLDIIDEVMSEKENVFASCIPVFSSVLRPISFKNENLVYSDIDKKFNAIYGMIELLNSDSLYKKRRKNWSKERRAQMLIPTIHSNIQKHLMVLWGLVFKKIGKKFGHIKSEILGGMINFSSRDVIIPDCSLRADEIKLNYTAFMELYKLEIIAYLVKIEGISENEANNRWFKCKVTYDQKMHELLNHMIEKLKPKFLINRNPTISFGSILCMRIVEVKADDSNDYTMSVPLQVLPVLNADFDGDVLNVISLKSKRLINAFDKVFNARKNMFISHNDGLFDNEFNLYKDQIITLYEFNNIE